LSEASLTMPYVGEVGESNFSAKRSDQPAYVLRVVVHGALAPRGSGSRVTLRWRLPSRALVAFSWATGVLVALLTATVVHQPWAALVIFAANLLVLYAGIIQPAYDAREMTRVLRDVCASDSLAAARSLGRTV